MVIRRLLRASPTAVVGLCLLAGAASAQSAPPPVAALDRLVETARVERYDIRVETDLERHALAIRARCVLQHTGPGVRRTFDLDIFARERFYGVTVGDLRVTRIDGAVATPVAFERNVEKGADAALAGTARAPLVTRVTLGTPLKSGARVTLQFAYRVTVPDPARKDLPYGIVASVADGATEVGLITDFAWLPRLTEHEAAVRELFNRNFFPRLPRPAWTVELVYPADYEGMVLDGHLDSRANAGGRTTTRWSSRVTGLPQVLILRGQSREVTVGDATIAFLLPAAGWDAAVVDAMGRFLAQAWLFYRERFGDLGFRQINVAVSQAGSGGHGAFLGMFLDLSQFKASRWPGGRVPEPFIDATAAHELAHSWWGHAVAPYGRGTKFLAEGLCEYASSEFLRARFGVDAFRESLAEIMYNGRGADPLFRADGDEDKLAYTKGSLLVDALRREMGAEVFDAALGRFAATFRNGHATFLDFVAVMNESSGRDWAPFLHQWTYGRGYPVYRVAALESHEAGNGWEAMVTIRNDGQGAFGCPLELRMGSLRQRETVSVPGGETRTFRYATPARVESALLDPDHVVLQGDAQEIQEKVLAVPPTTTSEWLRYWRGVVLAERGDLAQGRALVTASIQQHERGLGPGHASPTFYYTRAVIGLREQNHGAALADFRLFIDNLLFWATMSSDGIRGMLPAFRRAGMLSGATVAEQTVQLGALLAAVTGQSLPVDGKLEAWRTWWNSARAAYAGPRDPSLLNLRGREESRARLAEPQGVVR